ncbi:hypothetical protein CIHG_07339 [Coccidioides immitis H538.4]|uniref:Uncharacterized protein n=1 Tax=Coccidioides immitis H538.4 TaxID=396776 RepID=A0A0J8RXM2_COCIT|nr:hypothetical protein CIHG_07339 [Coccidioides immitis H538.4]
MTSPGQAIRTRFGSAGQGGNLKSAAEDTAPRRDDDGTSSCRGIRGADAYSVHPSYMRCTQTMIDVCGPILWLRHLEPASTSGYGGRMIHRDHNILEDQFTTLKDRPP